MTVIVKKSICRYILFSIVVFGIIFISRTLEINKNIANTGMGYFVNRNVKEANEAGELGYIKYEANDYASVFGVPWVSKPGVKRIIRSGPDDFDDIGYIVILELIALSGKEITLDFVEKMHNLAFIISILILSFVVVKLCKNILAGWIFVLLALMFKLKILSLLYGSTDSRTFLIFFPIVVITTIFVLNWLGNYLEKSWCRAAVLFFGMLTGMMMLVRSSEGMMALTAVSFCISLLKCGVKKKFIAFIFLAAGFILITVIMPIVFAIHRDFKTGEFNGDISLYLKTAGRHQAWHSIVAGLGKYPNSIGMKYDDEALYNMLRSRFTDAVDPVYNFHGKGYYSGLREIYFTYIKSYPLEYLKNFLKAYLELFYFIPYCTSAGNIPWRYGYLPLKPEITADDIDLVPNMRPHGADVINLKYRYLKLTKVEWAIFILAILSILLLIKLSIFGIKERSNLRCFLSIYLYMFMLATTRAVVPQHGLSLVVGFWIFSIMSLLYVCFKSNMIRGVLYHRLKIFNI